MFVDICYRIKLYCPFQTLVDRGYNLPEILSEEFSQTCKVSLENGRNASEYEALLNIGWQIGK